MSTTYDKPRGTVKQRALWWAMEFARWVAKDADLRAHIPNDSRVFVMPSDDPELCQYNLELADARDEPYVLIHVERAEDGLAITPKLPERTHHYAST